MSSLGPPVHGLDFKLWEKSIFDGLDACIQDGIGCVRKCQADFICDVKVAFPSSATVALSEARYAVDLLGGRARWRSTNKPQPIPHPVINHNRVVVSGHIFHAFLVGKRRCAPPVGRDNIIWQYVVFQLVKASPDHPLRLDSHKPAGFSLSNSAV
jgi:hypothetical protein